ncbi:recombinase family protein [bacterium]|nr:MAG: recombinase family protein [bacterium]MCL4230323.1 recombinase family protein [Dehalococcoidia bacterium]
MRAMIYVRVSTDAQERDGTSLDTQVRACAEYAAAAGWSVVATVRDSASGFSLERPGIERVRQAMRQGEADVVLAYAVDRLSRHQNHIGVLFDEAEGWGVKFEFVTERFEDTAIGRFILAARAFTAEVEREKIAERTMRGKAERARSGKIPQATGRGIYGYRYDPATGRREIDLVQAAVVRRVFSEFCTGAGFSRIASDLNRDGIAAMAGGAWFPLTVRRLLLNETYTGRTIYRRTRVTFLRDPQTGKKRRRVIQRDESEWIEVEAATPPIVDAQTWELACAMMADPARAKRSAQTDGEFRLRGHVRCSACGTPMVGQSMNRGRYRYYRCRRSYSGGFEGRCSAGYIRQDGLEAAVRDELARVLADPELILQRAAQHHEAPRPAQDPAELHRRIAEVAEQQQRLARLFVSGTIPEDALNAESKRLATERALLEADLAALGADRPEPGRRMPSFGEAVAAAGVLRAWLATAGEADYRLLLQALSVTVSAGQEEAVISGVIPGLTGTPEPGQGTVFSSTERTSASRRVRCRLRLRGGKRPGWRGWSSPGQLRRKGR